MGTTNKNSCKTASVMSLLSRGPSGKASVPNLGTSGGAQAAQASVPNLGTSGDAQAAQGDVPDLGTSAREQIEYIDIDRIDDDPNNFYALSGLDELAANIEMLGLQQPLRVRHGEERGRYVIVSGHRRRAAARRLVMEGHGELRDLPCIVEREQGSAALQELRLICANSDTRKLTNAELGRQAERVEALLYQLKEEGYEFPGRMRDHVAEACQVSRSKLARLKAIREGLAAPWRPAWEAGKLPEAAAHALAQMPGERQQVIFDGLSKRGEAPVRAQEHVVRLYGEALAKVEAVECRTYGNGPCLNREAMRERVMSSETWSCDRCRQCCDQCPELTKCRYACSMLADKVKQLKADDRARKQQERQEREEKVRPKVEAVRDLWRRFGQARAAAGKPVEEVRQAIGAYFSPEDVRNFEGYELGKEKIDEGTVLPYGNNYQLETIQRCVRAADLLGVSLDYLLCRTDDPAGLAPQPEGQLVFSGWMPGGTTPQHPCDVVADFDVGDGVTIREACEFDRGRFRFPSGEAIDADPIRWMILPPVEEGPQ